MMKHVAAILSCIILSGCTSDFTPLPVHDTGGAILYVDHPSTGNSASLSEQEIMIVDVSTKQKWRLTSDNVHDRRPTWSPSGSHVLFISARRTGTDHLYTYNLTTGEIRHLDLPWAWEKGPASPKSEQISRAVKGIECATWSPVDSTQIVAGVVVDGPNPQDPYQSPRRRVVLLNISTRTTQLLASYTDCGHFKMSPDGTHLAVSANETFDVLNVETLQKTSLDETYPGNSEDSLVPSDWSRDGSLLVKRFDPYDDLIRVYEYSLTSQEWTLMFSTSMDIVDVAYPPEGVVDTLQHPSFVITKSFPNSFRNDLFLYTPAIDSTVRLTNSDTLKRAPQSFHEPSGAK